jgi:hypothetical protein
MDRFLRERRLLLGISLVLLDHQYLGIEIERSGESVGLKFTFPEDLHRLWAAIWLVWAWAVICYLQIWYSSTERSYPTNVVQLAYERVLRRLSRGTLKRQFLAASAGATDIAGGSIPDMRRIAAPSRPHSSNADAEDR